MYLDKRAAVIKLGIFYLIIFGSLGGGMTLVGFVYDKIGLYNLGQVNTLLIFVGFSMSGMASSSILSLFSELKTGMFFGLLLYAGTLFMAVLTYLCYVTENRTGVCSLTVLRLGNYAFNFLRGFFGAIYVWTGQYQFIDKITTTDEKKEMFGIFTQIMLVNGIVGNLLNIILYTFNVNTLYCFIGFFVVFIVSCCWLYFSLPKIRGYDPYADPSSKVLPKTTEEDDPEVGVESNMIELQEKQQNQVHKKLETLHMASGPARLENEVEHEHNNVFEAHKQHLETSDTHELQPIQEKNDVEVEHEHELKERLLEKNDHDDNPLLDTDHTEEDEKRKSSVNRTIIENIRSVYMMSFDPKIKVISPYLVMSGLWLGFATSSMYRLVVQIIPPERESYIKQMISLIMVTFSATSLLFTHFSKKFTFEFSKKIMRSASLGLTLLFFYAYVLNASIGSIILILPIVCFCGVLESCFNLLISVYMSENFPGRTEAYTISKLLQNLFGSIFIVLYITMSLSAFRILLILMSSLLTIYFIKTFH